MSCTICLEKDAPKTCKYCECSIHPSCLNSLLESKAEIKCPCCRRDDWIMEREIVIDWCQISKNGFYCLLLILCIYGISFTFLDTSLDCYFISIIIPICATWLEIFLIPTLVYIKVKKNNPPQDGHLLLWILYATTFYSLTEFMMYALHSEDNNTCSYVCMARGCSTIAITVITFPCSIPVKYGLKASDYLTAVRC
jgi:hypothetical protein